MPVSINLKADQFERSVVFRYARVLPLLVGAGATVMAILAVMGYGYSLVPPLRAKEPVPAPTPPPVSVSSADIAEFLKAVREAALAASTTPAVSEATPETATPLRASAVAITLATQLHELRLVTSGRNLSWTDITEARCISEVFGRCYREEDQVVRRGVGPIVLEVLGSYDTFAEEELVPLPGTDESYLVNASNVEPKLAALQEITSIIRAMPQVDQAVVKVWSQLRLQGEQERQAAIIDENARVEAESATNELKYQTARAKRLVLRLTSTRGLLIGLAGLLTAGVLLAVLAIERNTRALEQILKQEGKDERSATAA